MHRSAERFVRTATAVGLAVVLCSTQLASQSPGMVSGTVTGTNHVAIADARVRLLGSRLNAVTAADGRFLVPGVPTGQDTLEVLMLGYSPKRMPVDVTAGATLRVRIVLDPVILETVNVSANAAFSPGMGGFEERRAKGVGHFFTREEIVKMQARQVTDVLRRVPGMRIQTGTGAFSGGSLTAQSGRSAATTSARTCPLAYYVNGAPFPLPGDVPINHYLTPDEIAGIEVYSSGSQIPTQFTSTTPNSRCGLAVIWTRGGIEARATR